MGQVEDKARVTEWINKNVVILSDSRNQQPFRRLRSADCGPPTGEGVFYAYSLCHLAAKSNCREVVQFLIVHCGADLSNRNLQIDAHSQSDADLEPADSIFTTILSTFHAPVEFLKEVLNSGVAQSFEDSSSQSRKTFAFGELDAEIYLLLAHVLIRRLIADFAVLCPSSSPACLWSVNRENDGAQQMNVLNAIVNSSDDLHCAQYELLKHPLIGAISELLFFLSGDKFMKMLMSFRGVLESEMEALPQVLPSLGLHLLGFCVECVHSCIFNVKRISNGWITERIVIHR